MNAIPQSREIFPLRINDPYRDEPAAALPECRAVY